MAARQSRGRVSAVNPDFPEDILNFAEAALRVVARTDIGGIEIQIVERDVVLEAVVLAPVQAAALAHRLVATVLAVAAQAEVGP
jgi:hypothetical protein